MESGTRESIQFSAGVSTFGALPPGLDFNFMRFVRQSGLCWGAEGSCVREQTETLVAEAQLKELGMCGWESGLHSVLLRLMADSLAGEGWIYSCGPRGLSQACGWGTFRFNIRESRAATFVGWQWARLPHLTSRPHH